MKKAIPAHSINKLMNNSNKHKIKNKNEKIFKAAGDQKKAPCVQKNGDREDSRFSYCQKQCQV